MRLPRLHARRRTPPPLAAPDASLTPRPLAPLVETPTCASERPEPPAGPRLDILSATLGETRPVCDVLSAQLEAVLSETETAALGFIKRVQAIDGAVDTLGNRMGKLVDRTDRQAAVLDEMAQHNAAVIEDLRRFIEQRNDTVRGLVEQVRGLERFSRNIRDVANTSKVLAINALIQAAHAGEAEPPSKSSRNASKTSHAPQTPPHTSSRPASRT
ncbi:MAG: hypothetical protein ABSG43_12630 [Solirubrobacteraceae bacterium]|jgi:hypothetical protein